MTTEAELIEAAGEPVRVPIYERAEITPAELAKLQRENETLKARLNAACRVKADDKVGFDWAVLDEIETLKAELAAAKDLLFQALTLLTTGGDQEVWDLAFSGWHTQYQKLTGAK